MNREKKIKCLVLNYTEGVNLPFPIFTKIMIREMIWVGKSGIWINILKEIFDFPSLLILRAGQTLSLLLV